MDIEPPDYVMKTLSLGPRNAVLDPFDQKDILKELDLFLDHCSELYVPEETITDINVKTLNYIKKCKKSNSSRNVTMIKKYLKENELLAVPFDKGIGICLMKKSLYQSKMNRIINLPQFEKIIKIRKNQKHPVLKEEERIQATLKELLDQNKIGQILYEKMSPKGSKTFYALAKVHKENTPVHPVLSMPGSAYYGVAKQVAFWLSHIPQCKINSSTKSVCDSLKDIKLDENHELISLDVSSLYTNVPVTEAISVCADLMYNGKNPLPPVDKDTFITLATLSSCDVVLATHNGLYRQVDGLAMGSPPAPHLANGWMSQFDNTLQGTSSLYTRYMDDILTENHKDLTSSRLSDANSLHSNLRFTLERETNGGLSFLDMRVINNNGALESTWYTKPTDTGLIMNYHALAPKKYKHSVVSGFVHRIYRACSSWHNFHDSLEKAKTILLNNQYPPSFFEPIISNTLSKIIQPCPEESIEDCDVSLSDVDTDDHVELYSNSDKFKFFIQYRGKSTEQLAQSLHKCQAPCSVIMTLRKLKTVTPSLKPPVENFLKSRVVYKITCPRCNACYVGQTSRHLKTRFSEHKNNSGPVKKHFAQCDIPLTNECVAILRSTIKSEDHLLTLEALYIKELQPSLNTKEEYKRKILKIKL